MDGSRLSVLFSNIASCMTLCDCLNDVTTISNSEPRTSQKCSKCNAELSWSEQQIVSAIRNTFQKSLEGIGIDLSSVPSLDVNDLCWTDNSSYEVTCDPKYLKRNGKGETPLQIAAKKKDVQLIESMLENGVNPNTQDNAGWTPLHEVVFANNCDIAEKLLLAGAIVNVPGLEFTTPLHVAASHNHLEMVKLLLKFGADPSLRDIHGSNPIDLTEVAEIRAILEEYTAYGPNGVNLGKQFQKKISPKPVTVFLESNDLLSASEQRQVEQKLKIKFAKNLEKEVTHTIVRHCQNNICEPTFNVLKSILLGCAIVNIKWLEESMKKERLVGFREYEVNGTTKYPHQNGPYLGRKNFLEMNPPLFKDCNIYVQRSKDYNSLKELIVSSGAKLLNREPHPEHPLPETYLFHCNPGHTMERTATIILYETGPREPTLKYNMVHLKSLSVDWFKDCIQTFSIGGC